MFPKEFNQESESNSSEQGWGVFFILLRKIKIQGTVVKSTLIAHRRRRTCI